MLGQLTAKGGYWIAPGVGRAYLGLGAAVVLWGTLHPMAKVALEGLAPAEFTFLRAALAALCLVLASIATGRQRHLLIELRRPWAAIVLGAMGFAASNHLSMASLEYLTAGSNAVLAGTAPLFAVAGAPLLAERPGWAGALGAIVGFAGVGLLAGGVNVPSDQLPGILMALGGAAAWAGYTLLGRGLSTGHDAVAQTAAAALVGAVVLGVLAGPSQTASDLWAASPVVQMAALWCGIAGTGATYVLWASALRHLPASRVAPVQYLNPPVGLAFAWLLLGEVPGVNLIGGAVLILVGVALTQRLRRAGRRRRSIAGPQAPAR